VDPTAEEEHGPDGTGVEEERGASVVEEERGTGMEVEQGVGVEAHAEETEDGAWWRANAEEGTWWRADTEEERASTGVEK
jgi:hypothetical protein